MSLPIGAVVSHGAGAMRSGPCVVALQGTFTTSTGVFAATGESLKEYSLSSFTSGVATLSFPKHLSFLAGWGMHDTDNASAASRFTLRIGTVSLSAGTAVVRLIKESDGTTDTSHAAPTGTLKLALWTGE